MTVTDDQPAVPATPSGARPAAFSLLTCLYGDEAMAALFSECAAVRGWLATEAALARAQARAGLLSSEDAEAIAGAAVEANVDLGVLWTEARNVGYPILPLVRMIAAALPEGPNGRVHYGATTQDIMDTGMSLQLVAAVDRLHGLVCRLGDALAARTVEHAGTVMAARTHAQQAVPTTLGAKLAVYVSELLRHRDRLDAVRPRVGAVSLFGAGGTNAAMGERSADVRREMGDLLGLSDAQVPWHVARDGVAEFGLVAAQLAGTCARLAREVVDLSRTEIAELRETGGHHRGASSTMPQKENPISSEAVIGMASTVGALSSAFLRLMEGGHERAAGEWQIEWQVVPQAAQLAAGCLSLAAEVVEGLRVYPDVMRANLEADSGLILAEGYMMRLAPVLGREAAHDLVYGAAQEARSKGVPVLEALLPRAPQEVADALAQRPVTADDYTGEAAAICAAAVREWRSAAPSTASKETT
jgi:3-carboxy-cis,cis-muconate cycloisomerase